MNMYFYKIVYIYIYIYIDMYVEPRRVHAYFAWLR